MLLELVLVAARYRVARFSSRRTRADAAPRDESLFAPPGSRAIRRQNVARHGRRELPQARAPGRGGQPSRNVAARPMPIALAVFLPGEEKPPRDEFLEDLLEPFKGEIFANRRHPSPNHAQIGDFEAAARVSQAVEPGVFALRPLRAGGQLVAGPQGVEINHAFRHFALLVLNPAGNGA